MITILYIRSSLQSLVLTTSATGYHNRYLSISFHTCRFSIVHQHGCICTFMHMTRCSHGAREWHMRLKSCSESTKAAVMHWYHLCASPTDRSQVLNNGLSNLLPVETSLL